MAGGCAVVLAFCSYKRLCSWMSGFSGSSGGGWRLSGLLWRERGEERS